MTYHPSAPLPLPLPLSPAPPRLPLPPPSTIPSLSSSTGPTHTTRHRRSLPQTAPRVRSQLNDDEICELDKTNILERSVKRVADAVKPLLDANLPVGAIDALLDSDSMGRLDDPVGGVVLIVPSWKASGWSALSAHSFPPPNSS